VKIWKDDYPTENRYYETKNGILYHADSSRLLKDFPTASSNLIFTSPPYNMRTRIRNGKYTKRERSERFSKKYDFFPDDLPIDEYYELHKNLLAEYIRIAPLSLIVIQVVTGSKEAWFGIMGDFRKYIKDIVVWDKGYGQPAMHDKVLNRATEFILIFGDGSAGRYVHQAMFPRGEGEDIWRIGRDNEFFGTHRAVFPKKLVRKALSYYSKETDLILDPFMGVGTTAVVAEEMGRRWIGVEIEEKYCAVAKKRIEKARGQKRIDFFFRNA